VKLSVGVTHHNNVGPLKEHFGESDMKILSLAFPGMTFIDLAGPMQAFMMLPEFSSQVVWQEKGVVQTDAGVNVHATEDFESCWKSPDILFVPGNTNALFNLLTDDRMLDFIADRGSRAGWVTSVCNGSLLLGAATVFTHLVIHNKIREL